MAKTPERAMDLMMAVWPAAVARVEQEVADMQAVADAEHGADASPSSLGTTATTPRRCARTATPLDSDEVKQYLQLGNLTEAMFYVAGELFGFAFTPVPEGSVPVFHPDVTVYEVTDRDSGEHWSGCGTSTRSRARASAPAPGPRPTGATRRSTGRRPSWRPTTRTSCRALRASRS